MKLLKHQSGITLVELVILMVVMGIIIPPLASGFSTSGKMLSTKKNVQLAVTETQACTEHIIGTRRKVGYASVTSGSPSSICNVVDLTSDFNSVPLSRTVNVVDVVYGVSVTSTTDPSCPVAAPGCKRVDVSTSDGSHTLSKIDLLLVDY